jgi:hypothetical protein
VPPCERRNIKLSSSPSKSGAPGENVPYLKLEKPRFLFLEGSGGAATTPVATAVALAGASATRAASSTNRPAASASTPAAGACSFATSTTLGDGGGGSHLSAGAHPPSLSPSSSSSDDEFSRVAGGESPCCSCSRYSSLSCSRCSRRRILLSFLRASRSCSHRCAARAAARARGVGGSDHAAFTVTLC